MVEILLSVFLVIGGHSAESCHGSGTGADNIGLGRRDSGLEVSQQVIESLLLGVGTQLENEEYLIAISGRLQTTLEKMLMAITDATNQVQTSVLLLTEDCLAIVVLLQMELSACIEMKR